MKIIKTLEHKDITRDVTDGIVMAIQRELHAVYEVQCTKDYQLRLDSIPFDVIQAAGLDVPFNGYEMKMDSSIYLHGAVIMFGCHADNSNGDQLSGEVSLDPVARTATVTINLLHGGLNDLGPDGDY